MLIFEHNKHSLEVYHRAISLMIGVQFASKKVGKDPIVKPQDSEQEYRRRELLEVEEKAHHNKKVVDKNKELLNQLVEKNFFKYVTKQINLKFDDKESLYNILHIDDAAPTIMDILAVRAASINRITPLVNALPWLSNDVINLVNKPQYRKNSDVKVTKSNLALSYIGLENLKLIMPTFMLKHWLPTNTDPFSLMKRKLWKHSLSVGIAANVLAKEQGIDEFTAFSGAMLSNLGLLSVTKGFLNFYTELYDQALIDAYNNKDNKLHNALLQVGMPEVLLHQQLLLRSSEVAADIVKLMNFERLYITDALFEVAHVNHISDMSPLAQIISKANTYVMFRELAREKLVSPEEAKSLFVSARLSAAEIALLKKSDIDHIKLNFKQ